MRQPFITPFWAQLLFDLRIKFLTPATYWLGGFFTGLAGLAFWFLVNMYETAPQEEPVLGYLLNYFWAIALILIPFSTMGSFSTPIQTKQVEAALLTPLTGGMLVCVRFIIAYGTYVLFWAILLLFPLIVIYVLESPSLLPNFFDPEGLLGSYCFILAAGFLFVAIGITSSILTSNPSLAYLLSFFSILTVLIIQWTFAPHLFIVKGDPIQSLLAQPGISLPYFKSFSSGVLSLQPIVFYITSGIACLYLGHMLLIRKIHGTF